MSSNFVISLDFELLWGLSGWNEEQIDQYYPRIQGSVFALKSILNLFSEYNIKCTVAYVGAMACSDEKQLMSIRKDTSEPSYKNRLFSSYNSILPLLKKYPKEYFFCPTVIEELGNNELVELASHTFSHLYCLEEGITLEDFKNDLELMKKINSDLKTIIFPRNQVNNEMLSLCADFGFTHFRDKLNHRLYKAQETKSKYSFDGALRLLDTYFPISGKQSFSIDNSINISKIKSISDSTFLRPYTKALSFLEPLKIRKIKNQMTTAAQEGTNYHLWWHPHNFGLFLDKNLSGLRMICEHYSNLNREFGMHSKFICEL